tara:strand:+ start:2144 stop:2911 length:768 start_codon:yes stop_codon:yes gene_type:complete
MKIVSDFDQFFKSNNRSRKCSWLDEYKGDTVRSDIRVHELCSWIIKQSKGLKKTIKILDLAAGSGALLHRINDDLGDNIELEIVANDYENQLTYKDVKSISITNQDINLVKEDYWQSKYGGFDVVLAIELIEHLDYGYKLVEIINSSINKDGFAIISSPNNNSAIDRYMFLRYGHELYFGERGYQSSGGHLQPTPVWLLRKYAERLKLKIKSTYIPVLESFRLITLIKSFLPWLIAKKNFRSGLNSAINVWILHK